MRYLRLIREAPGTRNLRGLEPLRLSLWDKGLEVAHVLAYSGAPGAQVFRTFQHQVAGRYEPVPESIYEDIGPIEWAGGKSNYEAAWGPSGSRRESPG